MKCLLGVILLVIYAESYYQCQTWCYYLYFGKVVLNCCSCDEKAGTCPIGCIDPKRQYQLWGIACNTDHNCPFGYKCCKDDCYRFHKICKVAEIGSRKQEIVTSTKIPTTIQPPTKIPTTIQPTTQILTTIQPLTKIPTTIQPTTEIPTTIQPPTEIPTTIQPTTKISTTIQPPTKITTTIQPTTIQPLTKIPTTIRPTSKIPTTIQPPTKITTTIQPTTEIPTTNLPTNAPKDSTTEIPISTKMQDLTTLYQSTITIVDEDDMGSGSGIDPESFFPKQSLVDFDDIDLYFQSN